MPAQIRPIAKLSKMLYSILKTPDVLQQKNQPQPTERQRKEWASTYSKSMTR